MNASKITLMVLMAFSLLASCKKENTASELTGELTSPKTLRHTEGTMVDYIISGTYTLKAQLTVEPGTIINMKEGATLLIENNGSLHAVGTSAARIVFKAASGASWNSIIFYSESDNNKLHFCTIRQGGKGSITNPSAMVIVGQNYYAEGKVSIRDCVFEASAGDGLFVNDRSAVRDFFQNAFNGNAGFPITITTENFTSVNSSATFSANGKNYVEIRDCVFPVGKNMTIAALSVPYYVAGDANLYGNDSITANVSIVFGSKGKLIANDHNAVNRSLYIVGNASGKIILKGEGAAQWSGIIARNTGQVNIRYAEIKNAGAQANFNGQQASVIIENTGSNVSIRDCVFDASGGYGIDLGGNTKHNNDIKTANVFTNCAMGDVKY